MNCRTHSRVIAVCLACLAIPAGARPKDVQHRDDATISAPALAATVGSVDHDGATPAAVTATVADLPMTFEPNVGQTDERVAFMSRAAGYGVFLTPDALVLALPRSAGVEPDAAAKARQEPLEPHDAAKARPEPFALAALQMRLVGANPSTPVGEEELETKTNYFVGNDPDRWHTDVPNFARVRYPDVYPGVDLVYHGAGRSLEYDVVVAPDADPSAVAVEWEGADSATVDGSGNLELVVDGAELRQQAPVLYQEDGSGARQPVSGAFRALGGGRFGVDVGEYDRTRPLVVDPVLTYVYDVDGTYWDISQGVAVDSTGATYIAGWTHSRNLPTSLGYDATFNGGSDAFVAKINPAGNAVVYCTYLGGYSEESANEIALDSSGAAFVGGDTQSDDFPMRASLDNIFNGISDAFVTKIGPTGDSLIYSTYLGGNGLDEVWGVASDGSGAVYVVGNTFSSDFPTVNAYDSTYHAGDAFVTKLRPFLSAAIPPYHVQIEYSTFLGGTSTDDASDVAVDASGAAVVVGTTASSDFPRTGHTPAFNGLWDAFVTKLSPSGSALTYSTLLGGSGSDYADGIAIGADGSLYVVGGTESADYPTTAGAYDRTSNGGFDLFVTKLRPASFPNPPYVIAYSTYLGGSGNEGNNFNGIAVDSSGAAVVVGTSRSADYPMFLAIDPTPDEEGNIVVTKLRPAGNGLVYSTFLSGDQVFTEGTNVAVDASGAAYATGIRNGAFVAKIQ